MIIIEDTDIPLVVAEKLFCMTIEKDKDDSPRKKVIKNIFCPDAPNRIQKFSTKDLEEIVNYLNIHISIEKWASKHHKKRQHHLRCLLCKDFECDSCSVMNDAEQEEIQDIFCPCCGAKMDEQITDSHLKEIQKDDD